MDNDLPKVKKTFYSVVLKRCLDILLSGIAMLLLSPLLLVVCLLELIYHGRPVVYSTKRPGKDGKLFNMYKFRSMTNERGADGYLLPDAQRLTKFGYFILALQRIIDTGSDTWTWRDQFENDIWYIENISFIVDVQMVFAIFKAVLKASEVRANATRVPFDGTNLDETRSAAEVGVIKHFDSLEN